MEVFPWHSPRIAFTSQAIETPMDKGKPRFNRIVRMLQSHGQCCPQFAPDWHANICVSLCNLGRSDASNGYEVWRPVLKL